MKVLLIYTNRNATLAPPPVGIAYLVPPLKSAGHRVKVVDLMFARDPERELRQALASFRPDVAGFSIRILDGQDMFNPVSPFPEIKRFVKVFKDAGVPTVLGGSGFSLLPREVLESVRLARANGITLGLDFMFGGPGETAETVEETVTSLRRVDFALLMYGLGVRISPEAELFEIARNEGFIDHKRNLLFPRFYVSRELDVAWARDTLRQADRRFAYRRAKLLPIAFRFLTARILGRTW